MIRFEPNCVYSKRDLEYLFRPEGLNVDYVLARLGARKAFQSHWLGSDLIEAWRTCPALRESRETEAPRTAHRSAGKRKSGTAFEKIRMEEVTSIHGSRN